MTPKQAEDINKKIKAAKKRYDETLRKSEGNTDARSIDQIAEGVTLAHNEIVEALKMQSDLLKKLS